MIGSTVSHYKIVERIGAGGMGVVYKAIDLDLDRVVAIKFLSSSSAGPGELERFKREARAAAALDHPNICSIHEIGEHDGQPFIVMAYIEGRSIAALARERPLATRDVIEYAIQIANGLNHAHQAGIIHRDIKSENLMVDKSGVVKILDFGLARIVGATTITETSGTVGTIAYMSPEQARGEKVDHRTDIWSLGVVMYEMLTGRRPFEAEFKDATVYSILHEEPEPVTALRSGVGLETERIVVKTLSKDREHRYQHADEMVADLRAVADSGDGGFTPGPRPHARGRRAALLFTAAVVLAAAGVIGYLLYPKESIPFHGRDWVLIAGFDNFTGDARFDDAVEEALSIDMSQSRYVNVFSGVRLRQTLQRMERADVEKVDRDLGREICVREGVAAMLTGRIDRLGTGYQLSAELLAPSTGDVLRTERLTVAKDSDLLGAIDDLSKRIRHGLGESLRERRQHDEPLAAVTTQSLDALRLYTVAKKHAARGDNADAIPFAKQAVELDPEFALAYQLLAVCYHNLGETTNAIEQSEHAMQYREAVSERERLYIEAEYYRYRSAYKQATDKFRLLTELYPDDFSGHNNLSFLCQHTRDYDEALRSIAEAARVQPNSWYVFHNTALAHAGLGDYEQALADFDRALAVNPKAYWSWVGKTWVHLLRGDREAAMRCVDVLPADGGTWEYLRIVNEGLVYSVLGQNSAFVEHMSDEIRFGLGSRYDWAMANLRTQMGRFYLYNGDSARAREELEHATISSEFATAQFYLGVAYARSGDQARTIEQMNRLSEMFGASENYTEKAYVPMLRGEIALAQGDAQTALREFQRARELHDALYVHEACGRAYAAQGELAHAAAAYLEVADHPFATLFEGTPSLWPAAHFELGDIYERSGDSAAAIRHTKIFLDCMRQADPELPQVTAAKERLARLETQP